LIRELLIAPEGRLARLASKAERQQASLQLVRREASGLERADARRIAAVLQLLTAASTWQTLRDYWDMSGEEAAETSAFAIELLLDSARARARSKRKQSAKKARSNRHEPKG
jgi:uncharacterized protein YigA (DUF484 family)